MSDLKWFHNEVDTLALQLEKLLKVINHSDPSAETMKHVLYEKYKRNLSLLAEEIKKSVSWAVFNQYLSTLHIEGNLTISRDSTDIVVKKLVKDFEEAFITRHKLSEFSQPDPIDLNQKERLRRIRKQIRTNRKTPSPQINENDLSDLLQFKFQQKNAKKSLDKLVKAFSKIDLSKIES